MTRRPFTLDKIFNDVHDVEGNLLRTSNEDYSEGTRLTEGGQERVHTADYLNHSLMNGILKELKKMNLHLAILTDNVIENTEVE